MPFPMIAIVLIFKKIGLLVPADSLFIEPLER